MFVDDTQKLSVCLHLLIDDLNYTDDQTLCSDADQVLYCDFEGVKMSRVGRMCIAQIATTKHTFVVDLIALGTGAWDTCVDNISLRKFLESAVVYKIIFDPRNDSDSLYHQFNIKMQSVLCLQLIHIAVQRQQGHTVEYNTGLNTLLRYNIPGLDNKRMMEIKTAGRELFNQDMNLWLKRPLPSILLQYSEMDTEALIPLYKYYKAELNPYWMQLVMKHSKQRVLTYNQKDYNANCSSNRFAPAF